MSAPACPACGAEKAPRQVEEYLDKIGGKRYRLGECPDCGVVWSDPKEAVGADWYAKASPIRHRERRPHPSTDERFRQFFKDAVPAGRLLDVGCGDGGFLQLAREAGFQGTGFDYDERVAAKARAAGLDAYAQEFSAFCDSRKEGEFDVVTLFDVLEHTPEPAWFLGRLKRLLRRGGHVAITLPNALRPLPFGREEHDFPPHHFTRWSPDAMKGFLERLGFAVVRQDAGRLRTRYLADHAFFYRVMPLVLGSAKRLLFGGRAAEGKTLTELYEASSDGGVLHDKLARQRLVDGARLAFQAAFTPAACAMRAYYLLREPRSGDCLYTLARLE